MNDPFVGDLDRPDEVQCLFCETKHVRDKVKDRSLYIYLCPGCKRRYEVSKSLLMQWSRRSQEEKDRIAKRVTLENAKNNRPNLSDLL